MMLKSWDYHVEPYNWIPIVSFSFVIFIASWAIASLPFMLIAEILPENVKGNKLWNCLNGRHFKMKQSFVKFWIELGPWLLLFIECLLNFFLIFHSYLDLSFAFCSALMCTFTFIVIKFLPLSTEIIGFHGTMFLFAAVCLGSELYLHLNMPETKGKSYEQIMALLR